jgi:hypothetical protein
MAFCSRSKSDLEPSAAFPMVNNGQPGMGAALARHALACAATDELVDPDSVAMTAAPTFRKAFVFDGGRYRGTG